MRSTFITSALITTVAFAQTRKLDPILFPELHYDVPADSYWTYTRAMESLLLARVVNSCSDKEIMNFEYYDEAAGFVPESTFYGEKYSAFGAIGTIASEKAIYVIFRAAVLDDNSLSSDFDVQLTDFDFIPACNCRIHRGYYNAAMEVFPTIKEEI